MGKQDDVVAGVIFLSSQEADYITGYTLAIDGGLSL
jgi:NAD(P)-dependent dehydrogenase (short-subunit alcohol dehydrogenase family)